MRPPGSGVPVPGAAPGSTTSTSTEKKTASQSVMRDRDRLVEHVVESARHDLAHLEGPHPLLGHPVQRRRLGPVAAKSDLQEPVAATGARLDEPSHRRAVTVQRTHLCVAGVGVGVEVDDRDAAPPDVTSDAGHVGQRDRVVTAEDDRDDAGRGDRR